MAKVMTRKTLALSAALALGLTPNVFAAPADQGGDGSDAAAGDLVVLDLYNLTDIHGHIAQQKHYKTGKITEAGLASVKCYLDQVDNENAQLTLLGDNIGASPYESGVLYDNPTVEALNVLAPLASTIGNHELDLGQDVFRARVLGTSAAVNGEQVDFVKLGFPYLGANVTGSLDDVLQQDAEIWTSPSGVRVAYIGAIAQDVPYKLSPGTTAGMEFHDPIEKINTEAKRLKDEGLADVVIAMLDDDAKNNYPLMGSYVDGLMGGDTHVPYQFTMVDGAEGNKLSAVSSGSYTDNLANLQITYDKAAGKVVKSEAQLIDAPTLAACGQDAEVEAIVQKAIADAEEAGKKVVASGFSEGFYRAVHEDANGPAGAGSNRGHESSLGDLAADAMRETIFTTDQSMVDIGVINAGGLRADLVPNDKGEFTYAQTYEVMPFGNELGYVTITGADFVKALEQQWKTDLNSQNSRPMLKLGISKNVSYTYDPARPFGDRITSVLVDGAPIDLERTYTIGSVTFLLDGGDSFDALTAGGPAVTTGDLDRDKFNEYLAANSGVAPRMTKSSVGVTLPKETVQEGQPVKVELRGLSFTEGPAITGSVAVTVGNARTDWVDVDNSLLDLNASNENAVITADGAGQAVVSVDSTQVCAGLSQGTHELPVKVHTNFADVVVDEHAQMVSVNCTSTPTTPVDPKPTTPAPDPSDPPAPDPTDPPAPAPTAAPVPPQPQLPITGAPFVPLAAVGVAMIAGGALLANKRRQDA